MIDFLVGSADLRPHVLDTRVKRGAELSTDHHLVVSWIRWWGRLPDRPDEPKRVVRVNWGSLVEAPVHGVFHSHLRKNFSCIPGEVGDMESEWAMFRASIAEAAVRICGQKVVGACCGGNPRTRWWTPAVKEAIRLKKEAFRAWLAQGSPETADWVPAGQEGCSLSGCQSKNPGVGGVRGGHGEGLSVGLKEVLANRSATQEGKAGLGSGCVQLGRRTADSD